jgi:hypothetical protein
LPFPDHRQEKSFQDPFYLGFGGWNRKHTRQSGNASSARQVVAGWVV